MASALYPDAQAAVASELDRVVGPDRCKSFDVLVSMVVCLRSYFVVVVPSYSDWDLLPQVHAFYLEAARWRPGVAGGFQHSTTKDILWVGSQPSILQFTALLLGNFSA